MWHQDEQSTWELQDFKENKSIEETESSISLFDESPV